MDGKLLAIVVPCYNSQDYLANCLDSVIQGGPATEVIVVDDGSTDRTAEIAREYETRYPDIVRLVQKENGGHGSAVNRGLMEAKAEYFKVVDSDDWLDLSAYRRVLALLASGVRPDILITNYVYEYSYNGKRHFVRFRNAFPEGRLCRWDDMQHLRISQLMLMHSMIYRTDFLRGIGIKLPEHTFYVDNLLAYLPLPHAEKLYYLDCDLYRYYIGREGQSVSTQNMIKRIDQQLRVTKIMLSEYDVINGIESKKLKKYMIGYLSMMVTISIVHISISNDEEIRKKGDELWDFIRAQDKKLYFVIRMSFLNMCVGCANKISPRVTEYGFKLAKKIYKFS